MKPPPLTPEEKAIRLENSGIFVDGNGLLNHCYKCVPIDEVEKRARDMNLKFKGISSGLCNTHGLQAMRSGII